MSLNITRREVLQFVGGSALGVLFSPLPWKLLDDTSIWTQNWPWIPAPAAGTVSYAGTTCTLCQSACGMRARSVGTQPVSLSGIPRHPFNDGALCTMGILAHHLRYHPARVKASVKYSPAAGNGTPTSFKIALDEIAALMNASPAAGSIVILDGRPGRTASGLFRRIAANDPALQYIPVGTPALDVLNTMSDAPIGPLGYDIDRARVILNFGAPLFDTWGTPARAAKIFDKRAARPQTIIHIEGVCSRSAERSDQWITARPGSEALLALSIANAMIDEQLCSPAALRTIADFAELSGFVRPFTPEAVSPATGVPPESIRGAARAFASQAPGLAIIANECSYEARSAVMALNVLAGTIGRAGGVAVRNDVPNAPALEALTPRAASIHDIPDHSIRALIIDESLSGCIVSDALLHKKLIANGAIIVSLSPFVTPRPYCTQYVVPSTVVFETLTDVAGPLDAAVSSLALSTAALPAPNGTMDAVQFALSLGQALRQTPAASGTTEEVLKQRCAAVHASKRGTVFTPSTGQTTGVKELASADDLWNALAEGGCWMDDAAKTAGSPSSFTLMRSFRGAPVALPAARETNELVVLPFAEMTVYTGKMVSPLLSKVSQESGLRLSLREAYVNPATARASSIIHGETIALTTKLGTMNVRAKVDASVMPDVIFVSVSGDGDAAPSVPSTHDVRLLCEVSASGSFDPTPVTIQKVMA